MGRPRMVLLLANVLLALVLLSATEEVEARFGCDAGPPCQCECLDAWDECAEGLPTGQAQEKCDPAYEQCWEENCEPV